MKLKEIWEWAEERGLNNQTPDRNGFGAFIAEENGEAVEAIMNQDVEGYVDACCDNVVFAVGDMYKRGFEVEDILGSGHIYEWLSESQYERITQDYIHEMTYLLYKFLEAKSPEEESEVMKNITIVSLREVSMLGYDPDKCMDEVMKEINSRVGSYSEEHKKWMKDKSPEAQANWYKADFSKCLTSN